MWRGLLLLRSRLPQDDYIFGAIDTGASGFLLKRTRPEELLSAIHAVAAGDSLLSPSVTRIVLDAYDTGLAQPGLRSTV